MSEHPTTADIRLKYATVLDEVHGFRYSKSWAGDFDRWLARVKAEAVENVLASIQAAADAPTVSKVDRWQAIGMAGAVKIARAALVDPTTPTPTGGDKG